MNRLLCFTLMLIMPISLYACGGGEVVIPDHDTNQPNFDQPVQATPAEKLFWTVAPTLKAEELLPIQTYRRGEIVALNGVKFIQNGLCGVLDYAGNTVIEAAYGDIVAYGEVYLGLHTEEIPAQGEADCFDMFHFTPREHFPTVREESIPSLSVWSSSSLCAVHIDREGNVFPDSGEGVFFAEQGEVYTNEQGKTEVRGSGRFALIAGGKPITSFDFEGGGYMANGLIAAKKEGKWGYVDQNGNTVIPFSFEWEGAELPYHPVNGFVPVRRDGLWGYWGADGKEVIPCVLEKALPVGSGGLAFAKTGGKWGVLRVSASSMGKADGYDYPLLTPMRETLCVSLDSGVLNMRKSCDANGLILATLENGEEVYVFSEGIRVSAAEQHAWFFCGSRQRDGKWIFGYCYGQFLWEKEMDPS